MVPPTVARPHPLALGAGRSCRDDGAGRGLGDASERRRYGDAARPLPDRSPPGVPATRRARPRRPSRSRRASRRPRPRPCPARRRQRPTNPTLRASDRWRCRQPGTPSYSSQRNGRNVSNAVVPSMKVRQCRARAPSMRTNPRSSATMLPRGTFATACGGPSIVNARRPSRSKGFGTVCCQVVPGDSGIVARRVQPGPSANAPVGQLPAAVGAIPGCTPALIETIAPTIHDGTTTHLVVQAGGGFHEDGGSGAEGEGFVAEGWLDIRVGGTEA